ncbi:hypothetical protein FIBSPDRAFT_911054 [Athelia psychrophila]|uniref:Uncharacterized protein n=1 Tax=Athelia psychrophila TaxID=1759441 RepID=A0A166JAZ0_9AGAM|nr:hypothetical protein FIBSPDRAFT_911054 [Fibularhizoctonia sp. CBS 109695]
MDKTTSVLAALDAGKLPNQKQVNQAIDWITENVIPEAQPQGGGELSAQGRVIANGLREVLSAYKQLGSSKNGDDILQKALWHLSEGDLQNTSTDVVNTDEAVRDLNAIRSALRTVLKVAWTNVSSEGSALFEDFASITRLALADLVEVVETHAGKAKDGLRTLDTQINQGERTQIGTKVKSEEERERDSDPKVMWQQGMDTTKDAGTTVIGVGQDVKASTQETYDRTTQRLQESYIKMCDRSQNDNDYHHAMVTIFDTLSKWINKSVDTASSLDQSTTLEDFIDDPTPEQHVLHAIRHIQTFVERLAGGKSLDDLCSKLHACAVDVRADPDLKAWFDDLFAHIKKSLDQAGYARSEEAGQRYNELRLRWKKLSSDDSDVGRKWKSDVDALKAEIRAFEGALANDEDLNRVKRAHAKLGEQIGEGTAKGAKVGLQMAVDQVGWMWQDLFNVYAPKIMSMLQDIPIPRTEFTDAETEFVLENVDISSFSLLPGHVYIRNITDIDISAPAASSSAPTTTQVGTLTHIRIQAMQLALKDVSFFYKDKTAIVGPSDFRGLMEFSLPEKGVDVDIKVRLLPSSPEGLEQRKKRGAFHFVERVEVNIAEDVKLTVRESNHEILMTMFKPVVVMRFRDALAKTLAEHIRALLEGADALAWDVGSRAEVFADAGLGTGAAFAAAVWSEIGRLRKSQGGLLNGWKATGTGFVKEGVAGGKLAVGAEPQILDGEKHGPLGTNAQTLKERLPDVDMNGADADVDVSSAAAAVGDVAQKGMDLVQEGKRQIQGFAQTVEAKAAEEKKREGWESDAFVFSK